MTFDKSEERNSLSYLEGRPLDVLEEYDKINGGVGYG